MGVGGSSTEGHNAPDNKVITRRGEVSVVSEVGPTVNSNHLLAVAVRLLHAYHIMYLETSFDATAETMPSRAICSRDALAMPRHRRTAAEPLSRAERAPL